MIYTIEPFFEEINLNNGWICVDPYDDITNNGLIVRDLEVNDVLIIGNDYYKVVELGSGCFLGKGDPMSHMWIKLEKNEDILN